MATSLNVGNWSWSERWAYPDQKNDLPSVKPTPKIQVTERNPPLPTRFTHPSSLNFTSTYNASYQAAEDEPLYARTIRSPVMADQLSPKSPHKIPSSEYLSKGKVAAEPHRTQDKTRPEQRSFQLWQRLNPTHCSVPFDTSHSSAYRDFNETERIPHDSTYNIKVPGKEYKEAMAKQILVAKEMAENLKYKEKGGH